MHEATQSLYKLAESLTGMLSVCAHGASVTASHAVNRAALQAAILAAAAGGVVVVPAGVCYGYVESKPETWPDFSGRATPLLVVDYGPGASYAGFPQAYDGTQVREFFHTPQTTSPGQHDGNSRYQSAPWNPGYFMNNTAEYGPPGSAGRTPMDNRRASFGFMTRGWFTWALLQGSAIGADLTDEEMSDLSIQMFPMPGDTLGAFCPLFVKRKTSNIGYGIGTQAPKASHHFGSSFPLGYPMALFEDYIEDRLDLLIRTRRGPESDCAVSNVDGALVLRGERGVEVKGFRRELAKVSPGADRKVSIDARQAGIFLIEVRDAQPLTICSAEHARPGQELTISLRNATTGAIGDVRWDGGYAMGPWFAQPAAGRTRSVSFCCFDEGVLTETGRTADI